MQRGLLSEGNQTRQTPRRVACKKHKAAQSDGCYSAVGPVSFQCQAKQDQTRALSVCVSVRVSAPPPRPNGWPGAGLSVGIPTTSPVSLSLHQDSTVPAEYSFLIRVVPRASSACSRVVWPLLLSGPGPGSGSCPAQFSLPPPVLPLTDNDNALAEDNPTPPTDRAEDPSARPRADMYQH